MKNRECSNCGCPVIGNRYLHESVCKYRFSPSGNLNFSDVTGRMMDPDFVDDGVPYTLSDYENLNYGDIPWLR